MSLKRLWRPSGGPKKAENGYRKGRKRAKTAFWAVFDPLEG
jgi:hypothetical protein